MNRFPAEMWKAAMLQIAFSRAKMSNAITKTMQCKIVFNGIECDFKSDFLLNCKSEGLDLHKPLQDS